MKRLNRFIFIAIILVGVGAWAVRGGGTAQAAGSASFSVAPVSGSYAVGSTVSVAISETSQVSDNVNAVQANLTFPAGLLSWQSTNITGPFTLCAQNAHGAGTVSLGCAAPSTQSGTQPIETVSFTVLAAGSAPVTMAAGSDIDNTSGASVWNGVLPGATYTLTGGAAPTPTPTPAPAATPTAAGATPKPATTKATPTPKPTATPTPAAGVQATPTVTPTASPQATPVPSEPGSLSFTVSDAAGRIVGAKVELGGVTKVTNANGVVNFSGVASGTMSVTITAPGDAAQTSTVTLAPGQNELLTYHLTKAASSSPVLIWTILGLVLAAGVGGGWLWKIKSASARLALSSPAPLPPPIIPVTPMPTPTAAPRPTTFYPGPSPTQPTQTPPPSRGTNVPPRI